MKRPPSAAPDESVSTWVFLGSPSPLRGLHFGLHFGFYSCMLWSIGPFIGPVNWSVVHLARLRAAEVVEKHVRLCPIHHAVVVRAVLGARVGLTRQGKVEHVRHREPDSKGHLLPLVHPFGSVGVHSFAPLVRSVPPFIRPLTSFVRSTQQRRRLI